MSLESDGIKKGTSLGHKIRHLSEGSTPSETNSLNVNKKTEEIRTYLDKYSRYKKTDININKTPEQQQGNSDKNVNIINIVQENTDPNYVFRPRSSVSRTPPLYNSSVSGEEAKISHSSDENKQKRPRSESSPQQLNDNKKPCQTISQTENNVNFNMEPSYENENNDKHGKQNQVSSTEDIINEIFFALNKIDSCANKTHNNEGNVILTECEQCGLRSSSSSINRALTLLVHRLGRLECENTNMKFQLANKDTQQHLNKTHGLKTYATVVDNTNMQNNSRPENKMGNQNITTWSTPEINKKYETIIRIPNVTDSKQAAKHLKQAVNSKDIESGFRSVRQLKNGTLIVESHSESQQDKLKLALKDNNQVQIKETPENDPMFLVTGIEKGYSNEEFINELVRLNNEIETELSCTVANKIKVITKRQCRNPNKENWILQAPPNISKWFLKKGKVNFDLVKVYVQEYLNLAICFHCFNFGHVSKYCNEKQCCHKCGGEHDGRDCQTTVLNCPNCSRMKFPEQECHHSARDITCPVYKRRLERYRNQVNYNENF